jgi:hypothetical protein
MAVRLITKKKEFLDRNYFVKAAFGILNKSFGRKSSPAYVKKLEEIGNNVYYFVTKGRYFSLTAI